SETTTTTRPRACEFCEVGTGPAFFAVPPAARRFSPYEGGRGSTGPGETDAGLRRLDDALAEAERTEQRWYEAELYAIPAETLLKRDPADPAAAEQPLQTAIAIAQSQRARSFELRAALSLAKLYRAVTRGIDAHAMLAPAVEGFPPTQQFPELTEAQTL